MPKAVVLYDGIRYTDGDQVLEALKGDTVELSDAEFKRLSDKDTFQPAGAVAKPGSSDAKDAAAEAAEEAPAE